MGIVLVREILLSSLIEICCSCGRMVFVAGKAQGHLPNHYIFDSVVTLWGLLILRYVLWNVDGPCVVGWMPISAKLRPTNPSNSPNVRTRVTIVVYREGHDHASQTTNVSGVKVILSVARSA